MKVLVFGQTGQIARELARQIPADIKARFMGREQADLAEPERCAGIIAEADSCAVINAASYTAVDEAEDEEALATRIKWQRAGRHGTCLCAPGHPVASPFHRLRFRRQLQ